MSRTRVCHVQESTGSIPLNAHVSRLSQPRQGPKGTRSRNLCLILLVSSEVRYAAHCVALDFDIRRAHLAN